MNQVDEEIVSMEQQLFDLQDEFEENIMEARESMNVIFLVDAYRMHGWVVEAVNQRTTCFS